MGVSFDTPISFLYLYNLDQVAESKKSEQVVSRYKFGSVLSPVLPTVPITLPTETLSPCFTLLVSKCIYFHT